MSLTMFVPGPLRLKSGRMTQPPGPGHDDRVRPAGITVGGRSSFRRAVPSGSVTLIVPSAKKATLSVRLAAGLACATGADAEQPGEQRAEH